MQAQERTRQTLPLEIGTPRSADRPLKIIMLYALAGPPIGATFLFIGMGLASGSFANDLAMGIVSMLLVLPLTIIVGFPVALPFAAFTGLISAGLARVVKTDAQYILASTCAGAAIMGLVSGFGAEWTLGSAMATAAGAFASLCCASILSLPRAQQLPDPSTGKPGISR